MCRENRYSKRNLRFEALNKKWISIDLKKIHENRSIRDFSRELSPVQLRNIEHESDVGHRLRIFEINAESLTAYRE